MSKGSSNSLALSHHIWWRPVRALCEVRRILAAFPPSAAGFLQSRRQLINLIVPSSHPITITNSAMEPATANTSAKVSNGPAKPKKLKVFTSGSGAKRTGSRPRRIKALRDRDTRYDPDVINRLPRETLLALPVEVFNELPVDRLQYLSKEILDRVSPQRLLQIPNLATLPPEILVKFPPAVLAQLPTDTLLALWDPLKLPPEAVASLPQETLERLTPRILEQLPPEAHSLLPPRLQEMLKRMPFTTAELNHVSNAPHTSCAEGSRVAVFSIEPLSRTTERVPTFSIEPLRSTEETPTLSFAGQKTGGLHASPGEEPGSTTIPFAPCKAQLEAKPPPLPIRPLDTRPRSGEHAPASQPKESHLGVEGTNPQSQRRVSQSSSTHSRESRNRQSISRRQAVNSWLGNTTPAAAGPPPPGQDDVSILGELMDLRAERDALRDSKARLSDKVQEMELALWRDDMIRKEHEEKIAGLEKKLEVERAAVQEDKKKLMDRAMRMESNFRREAEFCKQHWGQFWDMITSKHPDDEVILGTLIFLRELVGEYREGLEKEKEGGKRKEVRIQELQSELDGLKPKARAGDTEMSQLKSAHEEELEETKQSLHEQIRKLQKFGKEQHHKAKTAAENHQKELAKLESELEAQHRQEMDKLISKTKEERDETVRLKMEKQHAIQMASLRAKHEEQIAHLARMHEQQLITQSQLAQQRGDKIHEENMEKLERINKRQLDTESQLGKAQEENELLHRERRMLHASIQQLQADTEMQQSQHQEAMSSLRTQKGHHPGQAVDGNLRALFQRLQFGIEVVTEPVNLGEVSLPPGSPLDPDGFAERHGEGSLRFLLRHILWNVVMNGFFSAPFGFGVFGNDGERSKLFGLYAAWQSVVASTQQEKTAAQEGESPKPPMIDLSVFLQDPEANRWRSSTFASIRSRTTNPAMAINNAKVKREILGALSAVSTALPEEITSKVEEIVSLAGDLALETGIHESHLGLLMPAAGTSVQIGQEFIDCEDEYTVSRTVENVELGVCPYFYRVGDGIGDFSTTWTIARGKVYIKR
ncbi:hypothetical protein QBC40DRAFT_321916 [Triangularia verruculosa]|uniref:Uncharacterized protein n=1 Tax=Triangularia verruculosa TaxID=2587418 RepID=A0AAN6XKG7_9PEZI|nr:hypothetical protein QBC40DRAFT_321916 [Triangularia verruculosa]